MAVIIDADSKNEFNDRQVSKSCNSQLILRFYYNNIARQFHLLNFVTN